MAENDAECSLQQWWFTAAEIFHFNIAMSPQQPGLTRSAFLAMKLAVHWDDSLVAQRTRKNMVDISMNACVEIRQNLDYFMKHIAASWRNLTRRSNSKVSIEDVEKRIAPKIFYTRQIQYRSGDKYFTRAFSQHGGHSEKAADPLCSFPSQLPIRVQSIR